MPAQFNGSVIRMATYDKAGMLWFVTNGGLYRYDGNEAVALNLQTTPAIDYTAISCMMADDSGNLWLGCRNGLVKFDLKKWTTTRISLNDPKNSSGDSDQTISIIFKTAKGYLLAVSQRGELYELSSGKLKKVFDLRTFSHDQFYLPAINGIVQAADGALWLSASGGFLLRLDLSGKTKPVKYGLPRFNGGRTIFPILYMPHENCILFAWNGGVYKLNCLTKKMIRILNLSAHSSAFLCNLTGGIFILTDFLNDHKAWLSLFNDSGRPVADNPTLRKWMKVEACRNNKILLSNGTGLYTLAWQNNGMKVKLKAYRYGENNSIRTMFKIPPHQLLVGSYKDRFIRLNLQTSLVRQIDLLHPYVFLYWNADSILMGEEGKVLFWYTNTNQRVAHIPLKPLSTFKDSIRDHYITCLYRRSDSTVWVGSVQGLFLVNVYKRYSENLLQGSLASLIQHCRVSAIIPFNNKWIIATAKGLFYFNKEDHIVKVFSGALEGRNIYHLVVIDHKIWAGSDGLGLIEMDTSGHILKTMNRSNGLAGNTVFSLKRWHDYLIAGTEHGMSIIYLPDVKIRNFTTDDGLPSNECNYSALLVTDSECYIGTTNGLARFNAAQLFNSSPDTLDSRVAISELRIEPSNGKTKTDYSLPYHPSGEVVIPAGTSFFSIVISNMNGLSRFQQVFYRLSAKQPWQEVNNRRVFSFVNMAPGTYHLEIAGKAENGKWINTLLEKKLVVAPLYYQTLWFKILVLLIALCFIFFVTRFIIRYREKQVEKERLLRLKIAGDLHDEVGSTLAGISMQADLLLSGRREHLKEYLQSIASNGRSAVNTMGDIVWSIDPRNDDNLSLAKRMERYGQKTLEHTGIQFTFAFPGTKAQQYISQKVRQNIMLIFKEALTNICKHAEATQVGVSFIADSKTMKLMIADNGKGLPADHSGGHGLRNMQMRAETIGATLLFPEVEKGVTIVAELKV